MNGSIARGPAIVVAAVLASLILPLTAVGAQGPSGFQESFNGAPSQPQPWSSPNWGVAVHSRDADTWVQLERTAAHHGSDCSPFPATHDASSGDSYARAVFSCRDHLMTSINASGYGLVVLTPNHMVDWSQGEAVVRFDLSTLRTSARDWVDLWITPYEDNLSLPLEDFYPDLNGPPRRAIQIVMGQFGGRTTFKAFVYENHKPRELPSSSWMTYEDWLTPSATRRDTFELRLSRDRISFGMPQYGKRWVDTGLPALGWSQGVLQFGHHSYTPRKDCTRSGGCAPNTWHWDEVNISRAVPFTMIGADRRYVSTGTTDTVTFDAPAPRNSHLRFSGVGEQLQVDVGSGWVDAQTQRQKEDQRGVSGTNFWIPIPEGTRTVRIRNVREPKGWWGPNWHAKDFAIWSTVSPTSTPSAPPSSAATTTTSPPSTSPPTSRATPNRQTAIAVRARGEEGTERMALAIDGRRVHAWTVTTNVEEYHATVDGDISIQRVRIDFTNDRHRPPADRNLHVHSVRIGSMTYPADGPAVQTIGAWVDGECGVEGPHRTGYLVCNGHVDFRSVAAGG